MIKKKNSYAKQVFTKQGELVGIIHVDVVSGVKEDNVYQATMTMVKGVDNAIRHLRLLRQAIENGQEPSDNYDIVIINEYDECE